MALDKTFLCTMQNTIIYSKLGGCKKHTLRS
nr:MAG TPA: hypothetical protein [Caudoviricetes sp.]